MPYVPSKEVVAAIDHSGRLLLVVSRPDEPVRLVKLTSDERVELLEKLTANEDLRRSVREALADAAEQEVG